MTSDLQQDVTDAFNDFKTWNCIRAAMFTALYNNTIVNPSVPNSNANAAVFNFCINAGLTANATFDPTTNSITFQNAATINVQI